MKCSDRGIALVKEFEGFRPTVYADAGGKATVGYGHLLRRGETFGTLSEAVATELLCRDLEVAEACVDDAVDAPLQQCQFDALCSFVYNVGCRAFQKSTLLQKLNRMDYSGAGYEFPKWSRVGVTQSPGLLRRREAELSLFMSGGAQ